MGAAPTPPRRTLYQRLRTLAERLNDHAGAEMITPRALAQLEHLPARDAALGGLVLAVADRSGEHDPAHVYVTTGKPMGQLVAEAVVDAYPEPPTARSR